MYNSGDRVEVAAKQGTYQGIVVPSAEKDIIILKLDNGYNVGFDIKDIKAKKLTSSAKAEELPEVMGKSKKDLPKISLITTGGTITSRVDYKTGAAKSLTKPEQLIANIPELAELCNLKIISPFSIMSEDMTQKEWSIIADAVAKELNSDAVGVIVTHGTDTLHFTSAALSFALKNLNKPVAIVGGQRSSDRGSFDGAQNLICAVHYCLSDIAEVAIIMHGESNDSFCLANKGTKVKKMHSSKRDAFRPINTLPIAKIWTNGKTELLDNKHNKRTKNKIELNSKFSSKVALIKIYPGLDPHILHYYLDQGYKGIVLEGTGLGHAPTETQDKKLSWLEMIKKAIKSGVVVCMTTQCIYGRVDPFVYSGGRLLKETGVIYLEDMLSETAYVKLSWALGQTTSAEKVKEIMFENISGEITKETNPESFLY